MTDRSRKQQTTVDCPPRPERVGELDCLRGLAIGGIVFVNVYQVMQMTDVPYALTEFVRYHFFPIFSFLFGMGFAIFLASARHKTGAPRKVMFRRLGALALLGAAHSTLQPGEVLLPYAVAAVVFLMPASYLPKWATPALAAALLAAGIALGGGVILLIPGLLAAGYAAARHDLHQRIPSRAGRLAGALAALVALAAILRVTSASDAAPAYIPEVIDRRGAGALIESAAYCAALLALLRTQLGSAVEAVLAPMGRLALTNYVSATLIFVPAGTVLDLRGSADYTTAVALAAAIVAIQAIWSPIWLSCFRYGPLEWAWRAITWAGRPPANGSP